MRDALFDAQTELILGSRGDGRERQVDRGARGLPRRAPGGRSGRPTRGADAAVGRALPRGGGRRPAGATGSRLAAARGAARAAILRGSFAATMAAVERGDAAAARDWLLLREFRTATRFTRPGADATIAVQRLEAGKLDARRAHEAVEKDLLDAYQARLRELLDDAARGAEADLPERQAEAAAQAAGYFEILAGRYEEDRGAAATRAGARRASRRGATPRARPRRSRASPRRRSRPTRPPAAPSSCCASSRSCRSSTTAASATRSVTLDFEIQEAVAFRTGAAAAFADLRDQLAKRDAARTETAADGIDRLGRLVGVAAEQREGVPTAERGRGRDQARRGRARTRRCPSRGRRAPTSPTTT